MATKKEKIIIELDFDASDLTKDAAKLNGEIKKLNDEQKALKKTGQESSIQFQRNSEALRANKKELAETNKAIQNVNIANKAATGSMQQQKAQLSLLTAEYNKLSKEERENSARGKELNAQINQTTEDLKGNEEAIGDNRRSVGDYGKALSGTPFGSFIGGIKAMGAAFLANPLGLIIIAIVGALKALKEAFNSTEEGQNKSAKATAVISTIFQRLFDLLEPLASFIGDVLGAAFDYITEQIELASKNVSAFLELLGFNDAAKSLDDYTEAAKRAAQATRLIADARAKTDKIDRELIVENAKVQAQASEAREKALQDENISAEERKRLLDEAGKAIDELAAKEEKSAELKFKALQLENSLTNSNKEALDAQAEAEAELFNVQKKRADAQKSLARDLLRVENEIKKAAEDRRKAQEAAVKKAIADTKEELDLFITSQGIRAKTLEEEVKTAEQVTEKKLAILQRERKAGIISETKFQTEKLKIQQDFLKLQAEATIANAQRELDEIVKLNESKIEEGKFLNDELFQQEQQRLTNQLEAQLAFEQERLNQGVISEQEYNDAVLAIKEEGLEKEKELVEAKKAADKEQRIVDLENQREIDALNREDEFERRQQLLDENKEQELAAAEATGADKALIEAKYAKYAEGLEKEKRNAQINEALGAFQAVGALMSENAQAAKAFAISTALINAYQSITAVLSAKSTIPEPAGSIIKGVQAAAIGATALINVNKIRSTPVPKAERGIVLGGKSHAQGGVQLSADGVPFAEAEQGEAVFVINKKNTPLINKLDAINQFGGNGDSFFARGGTKSFLQDGGIALDSFSAPVQEEQNQVSAVLAAVSSLPNPVVIVQDVNEAQGTIVQVEQRANL